MAELVGQDVLQVAPTIPDEVAARFISVVGDGLLLQRAILGEVPNAQAVIALATSALTRGQASPRPAGARTPEGESSPPGRAVRAVVHTPRVACHQ